MEAMTAGETAPRGRAGLPARVAITLIMVFGGACLTTGGMLGGAESLPPQPSHPTPAVAGNLILNPGFEFPTLHPWQPHATRSPLTVDNVHRGTQAVLILPGEEVRQRVTGLTAGAFYVLRAWIWSVEGLGEITYAESHKEQNGKLVFAGARRTGSYQLTTLVFQPEAAPESADGSASVDIRFYTEAGKGVARMDEVELREARPLGPNLIVNSDFGAPDLSPWKSEKGGAVLEPQSDRAGKVCLKLSKLGGARQLITGLKPGTTYCVSSGTKGSWFRFGVSRHGFNTDHISINSKNEYVHRTIGFTTAPNATQAEVYFYNPRDQEIRIDRVEVREMAEVSRPLRSR